MQTLASHSADGEIEAGKLVGAKLGQLGKVWQVLKV